MNEYIFLDKEYIKYCEILGINPKKPINDKQWRDWCNYRDKKWPKNKYISIAPNTLKLKG
jgi:hypothetical protein